MRRSEGAAGSAKTEPEIPLDALADSSKDVTLLHIFRQTFPMQSNGEINELIAAIDHGSFALGASPFTGPAPCGIAPDSDELYRAPAIHLLDGYNFDERPHIMKRRESQH